MLDEGKSQYWKLDKPVTIWRERIKEVPGVCGSVAALNGSAVEERFGRWRT